MNEYYQKMNLVLTARSTEFISYKHLLAMEPIAEGKKPGPPTVWKPHIPLRILENRRPRCIAPEQVAKDGKATVEKGKNGRLRKIDDHTLEIRTASGANAVTLHLKKGDMLKEIVDIKVNSTD